MQQRLGIIKSTRRLQPHAASNTSSNAVLCCTLGAILEHEHEQARARLREASYQIWSAVGLPTARADGEYYQHLASCNPLVVRNELSWLQCCRHILSGQGLERRREPCEVRMRMQTSLDGAVGFRWGAHVNEHVFAKPSLLALRTRTRARGGREPFSCEGATVNARDDLQRPHPAKAVSLEYDTARACYFRLSCRTAGSCWWFVNPSSTDRTCRHRSTSANGHYIAYRARVPCRSA